MKVVLVCLDMDPVSIQGDVNTGAAHLYVKETLEMLNHYGVKTIAFTRWDSLQKPRMERIGEYVELHRLPIGQLTPQPKEFLWKREDEVLAQIGADLTQLNFTPDLIHGVYWYSGVAAAQLASQFHIPFIYTVISLGKVKHRYQPALSDHDWSREVSEQLIFEQADIVLSVSEQERDNLLALYPNIKSDKIYVIGRGLDPALFSQAQTDMDRNLFQNQALRNPNGRLLFVGRLILSKGYPFLFRVYDTLLADPCYSPPSLWIVGGTPREIMAAKEEIAYTHRLAQAEASGLIHWWGIIPREQMPSFYRAAVCTCLPSRYDPAARVVLESMACGTPVIMSPTGYSNEVVISGQNGYIADHGDGFAWINYIKALMLDPVWQKTLGARANDTVYPHYSMEAFWQRQFAAYNQASNPCKRPAPHSVPLRVSNRFSHWQVPGVYPDPGAAIRQKDIVEFCSANLGEGYLLEKEDYTLGSASNPIFHWITPQESFLIKSFRNKKPFFRIFWPAEKGDLFLGARERYLAEAFFSKNDFFIHQSAREDRLLLAAYPIAKPVSRLDSPEFHALISRLDCLHAHPVNLNEIPGMDGQGSVPLSNFKKYDVNLLSLNARFRGDGAWFSPAQLQVELHRTLTSLSNRTWGFTDDQFSLSKSIDLIMGNIRKEPVPICLCWGECQPRHLFCYQERLCGIDAESCSYAEPERDFGEFLWWMLDLRSHDLKEQDIRRAKEFLGCFPSPEDKWRVLGWAWLFNAFFLLWDIRRGRKDRQLRFAAFAMGLERLVQEIL